MVAWPLLVTNSTEWLPVSVGLYEFVQDAGSELNLVMAGSVITVIPMLVVYAVAQKHFVRGVVTSGL